jgi:hypothetical protein
MEHERVSRGERGGGGSGATQPTDRHLIRLSRFGLSLAVTLCHFQYLATA